MYMSLFLAVVLVSTVIAQDPCCSDGTREAFSDPSLYPNICGCAGVWEGKQSLAAWGTGASCGGSMVCKVPADLCGKGYVPCRYGDTRRLITSSDCKNAGKAKFVLPFSHCMTTSGCIYDYSAEDYPCLYQGWCTEPVCCGAGCQLPGGCQSGMWVGATYIDMAGGTDQGCASTSSSRADGIVCCSHSAVRCHMAGVNLCAPDSSFSGCTPSLCPQYFPIIARQAKGIASVALLKSIMAIESSCDITKVAPLSAAFGLMQLTPATAQSHASVCGVNATIDKAWLQDVLNAEASICIAAAYLNFLAKSCTADIRHVAAAYNGGPGDCAPSSDCKNNVGCDQKFPEMRRWECLWDNVEHSVCNTGYDETREYVRRVLQCLTIVE